MTRPDLDAIDARARAAGGARWTYRPYVGDPGDPPEYAIFRNDETMAMITGAGFVAEKQDAAHIAGLDPATARKLCAYVRGLEAAARALVEALDRCRPLDRDITCNARATKLCFDACDDPVWTCDVHAFVGGMTYDTEPRDLRAEAPARALLAALGET